jgi:glucose/arabinose dehydrogenase
MRYYLLLLVTAPFFLNGQDITLELFAEGFSAPVDLVHAGDERLFVVEKSGAIKIIQPDGSVNAAPFIDLDPIVNSGANERGLLGLAFHPDYTENGFFYVNYTANGGGATVISRFSVSDNPDIGDPDSESMVISIEQPFSNHNGGGVKFGPDGFLYIGTGDGGAGGDPQDFGQNGMSLLGKMLRLDIDSGIPYVVPEDNPFVDVEDIRDEIWATGLRNPWRYSFDSETGDLWIGDVGQNRFEEIDFQSASSKGGENYGWRCYEGSSDFNQSNCNLDQDFTFPVFEYANDEYVDGCSVTGGLVYRGSDYPSLYGDYIFVDFCSGQFWATTQQPCGRFDTREIFRGSFQDYSAFGEDINKEIYVVALSSGEVLRVVSDCNLDINVNTTNISCESAQSGTVSISANSPGDVVAVAWSDGNTDLVRENLDAGTYEFEVSDGVCAITRCVTIEDESPDFNCQIAITQVATCPGSQAGGGQIFLQDDFINACNVEDEVITINIYNQDTLLDVYTLSDTILIQFIASTTYGFQLVTADCESEITDFLVVSALELDSTTIEFIDGILVADPVENATLYLWYLDGELVTQTMENTLEINQGGFYSVVVQNIGCVGPPSPELFVNLVNTKDLKNVFSYNIFPNPFSEIININMNLDRSEWVSYKVVDLAGKVMLTGKLESDEIDLSISSLTWEAGLYFIEMESESFYFTEKLLKF